MTFSTKKDIFKKLFQSRKIVIEILEDRGYEIPETFKLTSEEFIDWVGEDDEETVRDSMKLFFGEDGKKDKLIVFWPKEEKLGTNIQGIYEEMKTKGVNRAIVIINHSVTPNSKSIIRSLRTKKIYIDVWTLQESQINITKHELVPKHVLCTKLEKKQLLKIYNIKSKQLPRIETSDPICRHFGAVKGNLFKIYRESETHKGKKELFYRIVG